MTSGQLAQLAGVSRDTLRHYERKGVLPKPVRTHKGYRLYAPEAFDRVRLVRRAIAVGFTLDELARLFNERQSGKPPCREALSLAQSKLAEIERQLETLLDLRQEMQQMIVEWRRLLEKNGNGKCALLLNRIPERTSRDRKIKTVIRSNTNQEQ